MQNENIEPNKSNQIKRNPTRFNQNVNRGENEKSFDQETSSDGSFKVDSSQLADDETRLGDSGKSDTSTRETSQFNGGAETGDYDGSITERQQGGEFASTTKGAQREQQQAQQQSGESLGREKKEFNQAGSGADYGAASENEDKPVIEEENQDRIERRADTSHEDESLRSN